MPAFDLSLEELERYRPDVDEPADFDGFWQETLTASREAGDFARFDAYDARLSTVRVFDVSFAGFGGQPVKGWFTVPAGATAHLPCVIEYLGYNGGRGSPTERLLWSAAGYAHFVMDSRGQPGADTPDDPISNVDPHAIGMMTSGIEGPATYYYRRLMTDAVRAVDAVVSRPEVDASRILLSGGSQGGGLALAVSGLDTRPIGLMCDVPFLVHYRRAITITESLPYGEISRHLATRRDRTESVLRVLSYFDGLSFAVRARSRALFSVALFDEVCPPSTVFAAYNRYAGSKSMRVYPYNHHEGGGSFHDREKLRFAADLLAGPELGTAR